MSNDECCQTVPLSQILNHMRLIKIYIETVTGTVFEMEVYPLTSVRSIKVRIQRNEDIPVSQQHLLFNSRELKDGGRLMDNNIQDGAILKLILTMKCGPANDRKIPQYDCIFDVTTDAGKLEAFDIKFISAMQTFLSANGEGMVDNLSPEARMLLLELTVGDNVFFYRMMQDEDGTLFPLPGTGHTKEVDVTVISNSKHEEVEKKIREHTLTMSKMNDLKWKMTKMNTKKKRSRSRGQKLNLSSRPESGNTSCRTRKNKVTCDDGIKLPPINSNKKRANETVRQTSGNIHENKKSKLPALGHITPSPVNPTWASKLQEQKQVSESSCSAQEWSPQPLMIIKSRGNPDGGSQNCGNAGRHNSADIDNGKINASDMEIYHSCTELGHNAVMKQATNDSFHEGEVSVKNYKEYFKLLMNDDKENRSEQNITEWSTKVNDKGYARARSQYMSHLQTRRQRLHCPTDVSSLAERPRTCPQKLRSAGPKYTKPVAVAIKRATNSQNETCKFQLGDKKQTNRLPKLKRTQAHSYGLDTLALDETVLVSKQNSSGAYRASQEKTFHGFLPENLSSNVCQTGLKTQKESSVVKQNRGGRELISGKPHSSDLIPQQGETKRRMSAGLYRSAPPSGKLANCKGKSKKKSQCTRCMECDKRIGITNTYSCHCGKLFCASHRYAEMHSCTFDYKTQGRRILERTNPLVIADKLQKL